MKSVITVHATMTGSGAAYTGRDVDRRDRMHGYSKCGYHFVICRDGDVFNNRKTSEPSLHDDLKDLQTAISICLIGGVNERNAPEDNFTPEQWTALRVLIRELGSEHQLTSVQSKTPALTNDRINQQIWRKAE